MSPEAIADWFVSDGQKRYADLFERSSLPVAARLDAFPRYVHWAGLARFAGLYELYKLILPLKGSIIDGGVFWGFSFMSFIRLRAILERDRADRFVYGFDSFKGFPRVSAEDRSTAGLASPGGHLDTGPAAREELNELLDADELRLRPSKEWDDKLIPGDAVETMPLFAEQNPHLVVSLLFLDFDLYEPTKVALETFLPRMPRGAVVAFDQLSAADWPGETRAVDEALGIANLRLLRLEPYIGISYAVLGD